MSSHICLFEDIYHPNLLPLVYFRPTFNLRCGILSLKEKVQYAYPKADVSLHCRSYLADYMRLRNPGHAVNVSAKERIEFALDYVGRVSTIYALGARGIMASVGFQVEPGFIGHIEFCMFNAGSSPFRLRAGEPIISLEIVRLVAAPLADPA